jgi:RNA polymerase sigma-B factor
MCTIRVQRWEAVAVVRIGGVLDMAGAPAVRAVLVDLLDDVTLVLIDLAAVKLLDGHSVGMLVSTHEHARVTGTGLWLRGATGRARLVLEITGTAKLCDPPDLELPTGEGQDRTVETLLQARRRCGDDEQTRAALRELAIAEMTDLAVALANSYRGRGEDVDDLVQVAMLGLIKAADRFDATRGPGFTAFAVPTIAGEIKRHFRDRGWVIRVPRRMQEVGMSLRGARENLTRQLGRAPTVAEIADQLDTTPEEVIEAMDAARMYRPASLSLPIGTDGGDDAPVLGDVLGARDAGFDLVEVRESLRDVINRLPERQQRILALRFYGNLTQAQIAERIGVSQMHISRLLSASLRDLRAALTRDDRAGSRS